MPVVSRTSQPRNAESFENDIFVGIDMSLTDTGIAAIDSMNNIILTKSIKTNSKENEFRRIEYIVRNTLRVIDGLWGSYRTIYVCLEQPGMSVRAGKAYTRFEIFGILKYELSRRSNVKLWTAAPTVVLYKVIAPSGGGKKLNSKEKKQRSIDFVLREYGNFYKNDNITDAIAIGRLVQDITIRRARYSVIRVPHIPRDPI